MTQPPSASSGGAAPLSLAQRFVGVLTSPKSTFESVVSFPRWFGIFAVTVALSIVASTAFFWSEVGQSAFIEQMKASNPAMPDQQAQMAVTVTKYVTPTGVASTLAQVVIVIANYFRGSMVSITSLQGLGQAFAEHGFMAGFLGAIDVWWFWYLLILAIGLGVLYRRRTAPIFMSFTGLYLVIAIVIGAVKAAMAGGS